MGTNFRKSDSVRQSEQLIINMLKDRSPALAKRSIKFSEYIEISIENKRLNIYMTSRGEKFPVAQNMQNDGAAFEGWAICLKSWLADEIDKVHLTWDKAEVQNGHYNRFLYRVWRFKKMYNWFEYEDEAGDVKNFIFQFDGTRNNSGNKEPNMKEKDCEEQVEHYIVEQNQNLFKSRFNIATINRHLPVGVKDKNGHSLFTGGNSAIDLWGIGVDSIVHVFELKYIKKQRGPKNTKVGIISELLLYVNIINDIRKGIIGKPLNPYLPAEKELYSRITKLEGVKGVFLTNELHPLLENREALLKILNANGENISFAFADYRWNAQQHRVSFE